MLTRKQDVISIGNVLVSKNLQDDILTLVNNMDVFYVFI